MKPDPPDEQAYREFVAARYAALLRTAYLLSGDWATAEDLLQTALAKTYLSWSRIHTSSVEAYTRKVLVNTATSWRRRRWHGEQPTSEVPEHPAADTISQSVERNHLWAYVRALPARQRAVLVLRFYEDLTEAETARLLGVSIGTVKSHASRAMATLRARMGAEQPLDVPSPTAGLVGGELA